MNSCLKRLFLRLELGQFEIESFQHLCCLVSGWNSTFLLLFMLLFKFSQSIFDWSNFILQVLVLSFFKPQLLQEGQTLADFFTQHFFRLIKLLSQSMNFFWLMILVLFWFLQLLDQFLWVNLCQSLRLLTWLTFGLFQLSHWGHGDLLLRRVCVQFLFKECIFVLKSDYDLIQLTLSQTFLCVQLADSHFKHFYLSFQLDLSTWNLNWMHYLHNLGRTSNKSLCFDWNIALAQIHCLLAQLNDSHKTSFVFQHWLWWTHDSYQWLIILYYWPLHTVLLLRRY